MQQDHIGLDAVRAALRREGERGGALHAAAVLAAFHGEIVGGFEDRNLRLAQRADQMQAFAEKRPRAQRGERRQLNHRRGRWLLQLVQSLIDVVLPARALVSVLPGP